MIHALRHSHDIGQRVIRRQVVGRAGGRRKAVGMGLAGARVVRAARRNRGVPGPVEVRTSGVIPRMSCRRVPMRRQLRHRQRCGPHGPGQTL